MVKIARANAPFPSPTSWHNASYPAIDPSLAAISAARKTIAITGGGTGVSVFTADVSSESSIKTAFTKIEKELGLVDVLVSNAGYLPDILPTAPISVDEWWKGHEVNVKGAFIVAKTALAMLLTPDAMVINVTTSGVHFPYFKNYCSYVTSKVAAVKLFEFLQNEYPQRHFLSMHPGVVKTDMELKARASGLKLPYDDAELPASFAVWLASPKARFLDGKTLWCNWDVEELKALKEKITGSDLFTSGFIGHPEYPNLS